tara:strand:+ start:1093 stop:1383 length:291 start_codon:yes stop_codon:yes gene_type:complete
VTEDELNRLADKIADIVIETLEKKQREWDQQFNLELEQMATDRFGSARMLTQEEILQQELDRLKKLLSSYIDNEQYESAAAINNKIKKIENKIKKL